ncbi:hypothetical protein [Streptomyces sp. NPDC057910]|uniref:hypothetical protein n=1 Tax=Streptomyces sp. NPDC057910 TaxID=3346278 RepID=UPI0036E7110A
MTDQPTLRDRIADAMRGVDLAYFSRERANQVADAVMADVYGQAPTGDVATWTAIRAIQLANDSGRKLADRRLALSQALGLGTGAPWDAIQERAAELHLASVAEAQPAEAALPAPVDRAEEELRYWQSKLGAVTDGRDALQRENARLRRDLATAERLRENADFHLGQEMARRQLAEKSAARLSVDRAGVLREAISRVEDPGERTQPGIGLGLGWEDARDVLRRMADEARQPEGAGR